MFTKKTVMQPNDSVEALVRDTRGFGKHMYFVVVSLFSFCSLIDSLGDAIYRKFYAGMAKSLLFDVLCAACGNMLVESLHTFCCCKS